MVYSSFKTASYDWSHVNSPKIRILNKRVYLWKGVDVSWFSKLLAMCKRTEPCSAEQSPQDIDCIDYYLFQKKNFGKKKCYPRPSTWYPRPRHGALDPRQKDRLTGTGLTLIILIVFASTTSKVSLFFHVNLLSRLRYSPFSCSQLSKISARI